ncbi:MBL fold metallo-hydrolase [Tengunoibacter tsumagoiensis]|uniref:Metallo-beta-lactamase domain-containing protein n=1 Tax=Tengunoibacter tsumagoiensis TaxID=2014871 RepID=A0A401ZYI9_9CHLR|nr:MBL fold metallo-hydrolase [Tengunoibacter tsumagoiensis]GCE11907.1 hypothetical protein KTT_17660 [Tengunoibacter tsumagoiensis]
MHLQRLTWAGLKLEVGKTTLFIDAIEDAPDWNSGGQPVIPLSAQTSERHAVITHAHTDHFDPTAVYKALGDRGSVLCHSSVAHTLPQHKLRIQEATLYEPILLNWLTADIMALAVPAADGWGDPQVSWIIDGGGKRIIHCGDTIWHGHWWNIKRQYGPFDLAFMPINGVTYQRGRFSGSTIPATMTPEQAVTAAKILGARRVCPIHYGMYDDPGHYVSIPNALELFLEIARKQQIETLVLEPGEWVDWQHAL